MGYVTKKIILLPMRGKGVIYNSAQEVAELAGVQAPSVRRAIYKGSKLRVNGEWGFVDYALEEKAEV